MGVVDEGTKSFGGNFISSTRATQTDIDYGTDNVDVHKYISLARFQNFKFFFMSVSIFEQLLLYALA